MSTRTSIFPWGFCLVAVVALLFLGLLEGGPEEPVSQAIPRVSEHAVAKHSESTAVQTRYNARMCESLLVFFSPSRGTLLFLCELPEIKPPSYGGLIYRITESNGSQFLYDEAYLVTVFVGEKNYWNSVVVRDGYQLWATFTDLHGLVQNRFPGLYW